MIAFDSDRRLFYEGTSFYGHGIWPSPVVSIATVLQPNIDASKLPASPADIGFAKLIFREDTFDPVTRVRRGRFYVNPGSQPQEWFVQTHPAFREEVGSRDTQGNLIKRLYGFQRWGGFTELILGKTLVALGTADAFTLWKVIGNERIVTGENLVSLRARSSLGILPEINFDKLPEKSRHRVIETCEKLVETVHRAGPESVVDRSRDAAAAILGCFLAENDEKVLGKDLGELVSRFEKAEEGKSKVVAANAARIIARLHPRCKPNEQYNHGSRPLIEEDGELAVQCVAAVLNELGYSML